MNKPLRVLVLACSDENLALIEKVLRDGGFDPALSHTEDTDDLRDSIDQNNWDLILADCAAQHLDCAKALSILRASGCAVPFIVLSESANPQKSLELMRVGVHDCISKENLDQLAPTVERVLKEAEPHREYRLAEETLQFTQFTVDHMADAAFWMGEDARFVYVNDAACRNLGYSREELLTMTVHDIDPDFPPEVWPDHWADLKKKGSDTFKSHHRNKAGKLVPVEISANHIKFGDRDFNCAFARDITARLQAEDALQESEVRFSNLAESSPNMIFINFKGQIIYANRKCEEIMGYSREKFYAPDFDFMTLINPDYRETVKENFKAHMRGEEVPPYDYAITTKTGENIEAMITTSLIDYEGEKAILGVVTDVTERKQVEQALRESEEKYSTLVEKAKDAVVLVQDGQVIFANRATTEIFGYTLEDLVGHSFVDFIAPDDKETLMEIYELRFQGGDAPAVYEAGIICKDGTKKDVEISGVIIKYKGKPADMGIVRDITTRKQIEEVVKESEAKYQDLYDNAPDMFVSVDAETAHIRECNKTLANVTGFAKEEIIGRPVLDLYHPDSHEEARRAFETFLERGEVHDKELQLIKKDGTKVDVSLNVSAIRDERGNILHSRSVLRDISEWKETEDALRESEMKYEDLVERAMDGVTVVQNGKVVYANKALLDIVGYSFEELASEPFIEKVIEECREDVRKAYTARMSGEPAPSIYEIEIICKDGTTKEVEILAALGKYNGELADIAIVRDITERKQAQQKLQQYMNELESFNRMAVGRELRMIELKQEVNNLLIEFGREEKYRISERVETDEPV